MFENFKHDDNFMDEWTKRVIDVIFKDCQDSPIIPMVKGLLKLADKELYRQVKEKSITIRQFKARCLEKLNGYQFPFTDYDDVVHKMHESCRNTDLKKIDKWCLAAFGVPMEKLPLEGPNNFFSKLEPWQCDPKCLKSISNFSLGQKKRRADSANVTSGTKSGRRTQRYVPNEWDFSVDQPKKKVVEEKKDDGEEALYATWRT